MDKDSKGQRKMEDSGGGLLPAGGLVWSIFCPAVIDTLYKFHNRILI